MQTKVLVRTGIIAAVYIALTGLLAPISFGALQFRVSEALTVLPILMPEAIPGLFVGVLISNIVFGGLGLVDIVFGSLATLLAAYVTYKYRNSIIAYLSPVVFNAVIVGTYLSMLIDLPTLLTILCIGVSEAVVVFAVGYPLVRYWPKKWL